MNADLNPVNTFAILIGMTGFDGFSPIEPASRNVKAIAALLTDTGVFGLPKDHIFEILDVSSNEVKILLPQYISKAHLSGAKTLLIYYTGHGYRRTNGDYFLTAKDSKPELIDFDGSAGIAYEGAVKKILKGARIPQIIIILDACYSGTVAQSGGFAAPDLDLNASYTLTSSAANEESLFNPAHNYTYFTAAFIDFLRYGLPNSKDKLTLAELYDTMRNTMREKGLKMSPQQIIGKELQPHLYHFCKNQAFNPIKDQIKEFEYEITQTIENVKKGDVKRSEAYFNRIKEDIEKGIIPESDARSELLNRIEEQLVFCRWYLKYEKTILKEIFDNCNQIKLDAKQAEITNLRKDFQVKEKALHEQQKKALLSKEKEIQSLKAEQSLQAGFTSRLEYYQQQKYLAALSSILTDGQKRLDLVLDTDEAKNLKRLISNEPFRMLVMGEFNVGKSTFINALIGEEILPPKAVATTAIISTLKYGREKKASLYYKNKEKEPLDIPVEKLRDYLIIKSDSRKNGAQSEIKDTYFSHAEIFWPFDLLKDNKVELIEFPGLNESKGREDMFMDYLEKADAVLFVMAATRLGPSQAEMSSINTLELAGCKDLFFVVNQWDLLRSRFKDDVKAQALNILPWLTDRENDIYFVSALDALEGRMGNDTELEQKSGFKYFETKLNKFLSQEKDQIKVLRSARELKQKIRDILTKAIPKKTALIKAQNTLNDKRTSVFDTRAAQNTELANIEEFKTRMEQVEADLEEFIAVIVTTK